MKLKEYAKAIAELAKNKDYENLPVIYSQDDEGNNYSRVLFHPVPGIFTGNESFTPIGELEKNDIPTFICIN